MKRTEEHTRKMHERRLRQRARVGLTHTGLPVLKNDPHADHSHARENARNARRPRCAFA